jgi:hypothetical protein
MSIFISISVLNGNSGHSPMQAGLGESVISISLFNSIFQSTPSQRHGVCDIHRTSGAGTAGGTAAGGGMLGGTAAAG